MNCPKCKTILPDDSQFCQVCGTKIEQAVALNTTKHKRLKERHCSSCGMLIAKKARKCQCCGKKYVRVRTLVWVATLLAFLLVASIGLNVYQHISFHDNSEQVHLLEWKVSSQKDRIGSLEAQVDKYKEGDKLYRELFATLFLYGDNLGHADSNFWASESVIAMSQYEGDKKITLVANYPSSCTIYTSYQPDFLQSARVTFDNNSFNKSTTLTVHPQRAGITTVTFSNSINDKKFVIIIVVR